MSISKLSMPSIWVIVALTAVVSISMLGFLDVVELRAEEPRRAEVALEMVQLEDVIALKLHGQTYYNKPPLSTWITASLMSLTGYYGENIARLPGALSFLLLGFFWFRITKNYLSRELALLSTFGFMSTFNLLFYGAVNTAEIDLLYALIVCVQGLVIFHFSSKEKHTTMFILSYALCAVGVMTKGMPSFAFQAITLLTWLIATKKFKLLFNWRHFLGIGILFSILSIYFYAYSASNNVGAYLANLFDQASQKSVTDEGLGGTIKALFENPIKLLHIILPWCLGLIFLVKKEIRKKIWTYPFLRFCILFIGANFILYWISSDVKERYLYMFVPFGATLSMFCLSEGLTLSARGLKIAGVICSVLLLLTGLGHFVVPFIPIEASLNLVAIILIGVLIIVLAYVTLNKAKSINFVWYFILGLFLLRLSFNLIVLPITQEKINKGFPYRNVADQLIELTNGEDITFLGFNNKMYPNVEVFGVKEKITIDFPPEIPFQIPYYYFLKTGDILEFNTESHGQGYYLGYPSHLKKLIKGETILKLSVFDNSELWLVKVD